MMVPLALIALAATPSHDTSRFHSAASILYIEVPAIGSLVEAYGEAPMVQMVCDPAVRAVGEKLEAALGLDLTTTLDGLVAELGTASGSTWNTAQIFDVLSRVRSASMSIGLEGQAGELAGMLQAIKSCVEETAALEANAVDAHVRNGTWPESLESLELKSELAIDPWGRPYRLTIEGESPRVVSLGADGAKGGSGADTDVSSALDVEAWFAHELERRWRAVLVLELPTAELASEILASIHDAFGIAASSAARRVSVDGIEASVQRLRTRSQDATERRSIDERSIGDEGAIGWSLQANTLIVLGFGAAEVNGVVDVAEGRLPSIASSTGLALLTRYAAPMAGSTVVRGLLCAGHVRDMADALPAPHSSSTLAGVLRLGSDQAVQMQLVGDRFVTDIVSSGRPLSWLDSFGTAPVMATSGTFAAVPADASGVLATRVDVPALREHLLRAFEWDEPNALAELEAAHEFDFDKDLIDPLDGSALAYVLPPATAGVPNATLVFDLDDPVAFEKGLIGLFAAAKASRIEVRSSKYRAIPMWTLVADREGSLGPFQVSPSVAILGKRALVTTTASWMRKEIKRLSDASSVTASSTEQPAAGSGWVPPTSFPVDATWLGSMDWASTISALYKVGRAALALGGMIDLPFDLAKVNAALPDTADPFTRFVRPTIGWGRRIEGGIHTRIDSSFGPETWISVAGFAASVPRWMATTAARRTSEPGAGQASEAKAGAQELDETLVTLGFLSSRLAVYRIEHKRFPIELSDLCLPTASFPRGFVDGDTLPSDGWSRDFVYDTTAAGDSYRLWSIGPDGVDGRGSGDDVVAH